MTHNLRAAAISVLALITIVLFTIPALGRAETGKIEFNRDVRPILSENCLPCHGPDRSQRKADLRLDQSESVLQKGVLVPGHPEKSAIVSRINSNSPGTLMPPASSHRKLTAAQRDIITRWIKQGGQYQQHWAYIVPKRPSVPKLKSARLHPVNAIDAFILAKLELKGIAPSPEADKRTLLRRLYLDLIGIPPTPEQLNEFLNDRSPNAYEKQVDKLLASPHYGERMATPWLDLVRYADTVGFHGDQNMNAWPFRDYVIDSFNKNKPFDQFTREQLAGDLLPNPTPEMRIATCQNRLNMVTREGGAQPKEYLAKYAADRVRTVSIAWLGSTMGCCECHDHKYDPFKAKDFYSMEAFFADIRQWGVYADYGYTPNPDLRGIGNDDPFPPEIRVENRYLKERIAHEHQQMLAIGRGIAPQLEDPKARAGYQAWRDAAAAFLKSHQDGWEVAAGTALEGDPAVIHPQPDGTAVFDAKATADSTLRVAPGTAWVASIRLDLLPGGDGTILRGGDKPGTLTLKASLVPVAGGAAKPVTFRYAGADYYKPRFANSFEVRGIQGGWRLSADHLKEPNVSVWQPTTPIHLEAGDRIQLSLSGVKLSAIRVATSPFSPVDPDHPEIDAGLAKALQSDADPHSRPLALLAYLQGTAWNPAAFAQLRPLEQEIIQAHGGTTPVMVTETWNPATTKVLPRGNWQDESGEVVQPAIPAFLANRTGNSGPKLASLDTMPVHRLTRLDLANWIVSPDNPLTARVFVDRLWKQLFGTGISDQVEDFGTQGDPPSNPELLDWLAVEFRESGWDVKHMVKLIAMSGTYRQSSRPRPDLRPVDPNNRLFAMQNPRRLDAEFVRDNALAIAGILNEDIGGPPCKPYQPAGYYANLQFPDRDYKADSNDRQWRRGIYTHWQRTFLQPMLANFGAPSREDCTAIRTVTNTPQQALTLLNDPSFVEAARRFADRISTVSGDAVRIDRAYEIALCRLPSANEKQSLLAFLNAMRADYKQRPEDAKKLETVGISPDTSKQDQIEQAAWASVCRVILNLHETITRY